MCGFSWHQILATPKDIVSLSILDRFSLSHSWPHCVRILLALIVQSVVNTVPATKALCHIENNHDGPLQSSNIHNLDKRKMGTNEIVPVHLIASTAATNIFKAIPAGLLLTEIGSTPPTRMCSLLTPEFFLSLYHINRYASLHSRYLSTSGEGPAPRNIFSPI